MLMKNGKVHKSPGTRALQPSFLPVTIQIFTYVHTCHSITTVLNRNLMRIHEKIKMHENFKFHIAIA
jgi:hypothetical protein